MRRLSAAAAMTVALLIGVTLLAAAPASANTVGRTRLTVENPVVIRNPLGTRADYTVRINLRPQQCVVFTRFTLKDPSGDRFYLRDYRSRQCANRNGVLRVSGWFQMSRRDEEGQWLAKVFWRGGSGVVNGSYDYFQVINRLR